MGAGTMPIRSEAVPPRIVLDTNVCLDLFLFNDALSSHVLAALRRGEVQAVVDDACRDEWLRVLHYPQLPIDEGNRTKVHAAWEETVAYVPNSALQAFDETSLPRCGDPDDQKFLELALASGARWLLSKDRELLKLDGRTRRAGLFTVCLPQQWSMSDVRSG